MTTHYRVWIHIETVDDTAENYQPLATGESPTASFTSHRRAYDFAAWLFRIGSMSTDRIFMQPDTDDAPHHPGSCDDREGRS